MERIMTAGVLLLSLYPSTTSLAIGTGDFVLSYDTGTDPSPSYVTPTAAIGLPERFTGEGVFPGAVSPFNPPFLTTEVTSIGEGGHLTLRLSNQLLPDATGPELGVFTNVGLADADGDFNNGAATASGLPVQTFGVDSAIVDVSKNGTDWVSLGLQTFNLPTSGYTDLIDPSSSIPGTVESAFDQPFTDSLDDFAGLDYFDGGGLDILDLLGGSGGGTWLDISASGLSHVSYVRFRITDDGDSETKLNFDLDAVTIAAGALGVAIPEPSTLGMAMLAVMVFRRRRRGAPWGAP